MAAVVEGGAGRVDVVRLVAELEAMTVAGLRARYEQVYGEPWRSNNKPHLVRRIAWRVQALAEGDLSERARRRAAELANDADLRVRPPRDTLADIAAASTGTMSIAIGSPARDPRLPMPGSLLRREYRGRRVVVQVLDEGFEFEGTVYRSLSAVARAVTGSQWNGLLFFGLTAPKEKAKEGAR